VRFRFRGRSAGVLISGVADGLKVSEAVDAHEAGWTLRTEFSSVDSRLTSACIFSSLDSLQKPALHSERLLTFWLSAEVFFYAYCEDIRPWSRCNFHTDLYDRISPDVRECPVPGRILVEGPVLPTFLAWHRSHCDVGQLCSRSLVAEGTRTAWMPP
jgi:hypothetical protein